MAPINNRRYYYIQRRYLCYYRARTVHYYVTLPRTSYRAAVVIMKVSPKVSLLLL
jgi:hypothetical protein